MTFAAATSAQELMAPESVAPVDDGLITIESDSQSADNVTGVVTADWCSVVMWMSSKTMAIPSELSA